MGGSQTKEEMPPFEKLKAQARGICGSKQEALAELLQTRSRESCCVSEQSDCTLAEVRSLIMSHSALEVLEVFSEMENHNVPVSRSAVVNQYQAMIMRKEWRKWDEILDENPQCIEQADEHGNTLLHIALQHQNREAATRLIQRGSMWNVLNNNRENAKTIACSVGNAQILALMLQIERQIERQRHTIAYPATPSTFIFNVTPSISWTLKAPSNQTQASLRGTEVERSAAKSESAQMEAEMHIETLQEMRKVIRRFSALL